MSDNLYFQFYFSQTGVKVMCLCPSVAQTPILSGCTTAEINKMKKDVGGLMTPQFVADALVKLLDDDINGGVMAAWNKVPPYYIPDTGMALFIFYTTCAMICRSGILGLFRKMLSFLGDFSNLFAGSCPG